MTAISSKKTAKREKWNRAVSKKFYEFIRYQICLAKEVSEEEEVRVDVMMDRFDEYIEKGTVEVDFNNTEHVVFSMLQPYIDQAVARSRRAREAAARRREARQASEVNTIAQKRDDASDTSITTDAQSDKDRPIQSATPLSREEKRAIRREEARQRRQQKHNRRLQTRSKAPVQQQVPNAISTPPL